MTPAAIVPFESGRRAELLRLMETVWGSYMRADEWEWWFARNPAGHALISLAEVHGLLVGAAAMAWFDMDLDGVRQRVPIPAHVATRPDHRGRGIFSALQLENERRALAAGSPVTVTFPNEASQRVFVGRLGWENLRYPRVWVRPLPFSGSVRGIDRIARFSPEIDRIRPRRGGIVRTARYLNWRFIDTPRHYQTLAGDGCYAVLGETTARGVRLPFLADFAAPPAQGRRLLRAALAAAGPAVALLAFDPPLEHRQTFVTLGFVPTPKRMLLLGKTLAPGVRLPAWWYFTMGDLDFV